MTLEIPLSRGLVALVDIDDYEQIVTAGKWYAFPHHNTSYARRCYRRDGKNLHIAMHTFITGWGFVDHVNRNGLDNRRSNLRPATAAQNQMNRGIPRNNTTGFKGVYRDRLNRLKWRARIQADGRRIGLGTFATPLEAALAYDAAALHYYAEFARPNFPQEIGA